MLLLWQTLYALVQHALFCCSLVRAAAACSVTGTTATGTYSQPHNIPRRQSNEYSHPPCSFPASEFGVQIALSSSDFNNASSIAVHVTRGWKGSFTLIEYRESIQDRRPPFSVIPLEKRTTTILGIGSDVPMSSISVFDEEVLRIRP
ncbi:hypothetical protein BDN70DRAFT_926159, partial [Pholiota conissans]